MGCIKKSLASCYQKSFEMVQPFRWSIVQLVGRLATVARLDNGGSESK
jgi:hypothetical protein